jgi:very-short-patch-repair endonuclease
MPWNEPPKTFIAARARTNAKKLRHTLTEAEKRFWWHLRHRLPVEGSHFRRQVALGPYVADYCCLSARLIIEVDGAQHGFEAGTAYDARRDADLQSEGFHLLRFPNRMVLREIDTVLDTIHAALAAADAPRPDSAGQAEPPPPPASSPEGGGAFAER